MNQCRCGIRQPIIRTSEFIDLERLFKTFDEVIFNSEALMVARCNVKLPVFGHVTISYFDRENHCKVFPKNSQPGSDDDLLNFCPQPFETKQQLVDQILNALKNKVADTLQ